jgi:hypothetical protein
MTIEEEMSRLPKLKHVGIALVQFVYSLQNGTFAKKTEWIYSSNFVAFGIPKRVEKIHLILKEYPKEIVDPNLLPLFAGRWNFVRGEITSPRQLECAARYIAACHRIWYQDIVGKPPK